MPAGRGLCRPHLPQHQYSRNLHGLRFRVEGLALFRLWEIWAGEQGVNVGMLGFAGRPANAHGRNS